MGYTWQYYDVILLAMAASMVGGAGVGLFTPVSLVVAVIVAGCATVLLMGHALFVNGPVDEPSDLTDEVAALN